MIVGMVISHCYLRHSNFKMNLIFGFLVHVCISESYQSNSIESQRFEFAFFYLDEAHHHLSSWRCLA